MPIRVQRKRSKGWRMPENTVSVCRPGKYGNPFVIGADGPLGRRPVDNEGAVGFFMDMLSDPEMRAASNYPSNETIRIELGGKNLACFCPINAPCHADILLGIANASIAKTCSGVRSSGYWKGYPCGSVAKYTGKDGKRYCANHFALVNSGEAP